MQISTDTRQAYSEIDTFISLLTEEEQNEIPKKLREFFKTEKDKEYVKDINIDIPIKDQNLKEETLALIAMLNLQYWCKDEEEKKRLMKIYSDNEKKYQEELREKYNPDNIFKKKEEICTENVENKFQVVEYKESFFRRIKNKILKFFFFK